MLVMSESTLRRIIAEAVDAKEIEKYKKEINASIDAANDRGANITPDKAKEMMDQASVTYRKSLKHGLAQDDTVKMIKAGVGR